MRLQICAVLIALLAVLGCKKNETSNTATSETTDTSPTATTSTTETVKTTTATNTAGTSTTSTAAQLNDKDKDFVQAAAKGGLAEVDLATDASTHATNADVKSFALKLVEDHNKANSELTKFASDHGVGTPTTEMEGKMKEAKERLAKLTKKDFDHAFVKQMIEDHQATITKFEDESRNGTDNDLKAWVNKTLPTLKEHLKMAEDLQKKIGGK